MKVKQVDAVTIELLPSEVEELIDFLAMIKDWDANLRANYPNMLSLLAELEMLQKKEGEGEKK